MMGAFDYVWNVSQSGQIQDLQDKVEELEKKTKMLKEWIDYLHNEIKVLKNERTN